LAPKLPREATVPLFYTTENRQSADSMPFIAGERVQGINAFIL
jgi:hypothetical protein